MDYLKFAADNAQQEFGRKCNECGHAVPASTHADSVTDDAGEVAIVYLCPACSIKVDLAAGHRPSR